MGLQFYFKRILRDPLKLTVTIILFSLPILEVGQIAWNIYQGYEHPVPHYATFLALFTLRHHLHRIMFWFLPLFLLVIANEDSIEDFDRGYHNALVARVGKKNYVMTKLKGSFVLCFGIVFLGLVVNMILVYICFRNGDFVRDDWQGVSYTDRDLTRITMPHPVLTNMAYILLTSVLSGLIGTVGTALALTVKNRKLVYGLTFLLWFVPVNMESSLMYVIQPFLFVDYEVVVPTLLMLLFGYTAVIAAAAVLEVRSDQV